MNSSTRIVFGNLLRFTKQPSNQWMVQKDEQVPITIGYIAKDRSLKEYVFVATGSWWLSETHIREILHFLGMLNVPSVVVLARGWLET